MPRNDEEQSLGDALNSYLQHSKLRKGIDQVKLAEAWSEVLGPGVANYTRSVRLSGSTLYVSLKSSVLREELSLGRSKIIAMLNEHVGREVVEQLYLQ
jgi:predicted nucleic acid-binding Zn ribbon protein